MTFHYDKQQDDELTLREGDIITDVKRVNNHNTLCGLLCVSDAPIVFSGTSQKGSKAIQVHQLPHSVSKVKGTNC